MVIPYVGYSDDYLKTLKHQCWIFWTLKVPGCKKIMGHPVQHVNSSTHTIEYEATIGIVKGKLNM